MIEKIVVGGATLAALQFAAFDALNEQGRAIVAQAEQTQQAARAQACDQAKRYGLAELRARGLEVMGCEE